MKNKRYKRVAKRLKGECQKNNTECSACAALDICLKNLYCEVPDVHGIYELRKILKGERMFN
ncbi:hypothetical protein [Cetobacterium sp.]|uniref:hypothetical protein n=1 Tax=Cetobacterium sp. TaxID=2071632 RepID=UPI003EE42B5B